MKDAITKIRPPVKWHGGKHFLSAKIIDLFPVHHTYIEPFGGAASVLLNKPPAPIEVYNDLNQRLTRLFRVLRDRGEELRMKLLLTPYSELEFKNSTEAHDDEVEQARRDFVRWRQSIGGRGDAFSKTLHRVRRGMADVVSGYLSAIDDELPKIIDRLQTVQILCRSALDVILTYDSAETLFYCDPPYLPETRANWGKAKYECEMDEADHRALALALIGCQGKVVLSGYPSTLYDELYNGWRVVEFDMANHAASGTTKQRVKERLWLNWHDNATQPIGSQAKIESHTVERVTSLALGA